MQFLIITSESENDSILLGFNGFYLDLHRDKAKSVICLVPTKLPRTDLLIACYITMYKDNQIKSLHPML